MDELEALYREHQHIVWAVVRGHVWDNNEWDDVNGDIWLRVVEKFGMYDQGKARFGSWLYSLAKNLCIDYFRSMRRQRRAISLDELVFVGPGIVDMKGVEYVIMANQGMECIHEAIMALPSRQRIVVCLRYLNGMSIRETAVFMDLSEGAVKLLLHRGVGKLRESLDRVEA